MVKGTFERNSKRAIITILQYRKKLKLKLYIQNISKLTTFEK